MRGTSRPVVGDGQVYMGFADGHLVALDLEKGVALWDKQLSTSGGTQFLDVDTTPVLADGKLFVASYKDGVSCARREDGRADVDHLARRPHCADGRGATRCSPPATAR